jgi:hypothetical protein
MSHIKTAHDMGVRKALKEAGYASMDDVYKQAESIGLIPARQPAGTLDSLLASLSKR